VVERVVGVGLVEEVDDAVDDSVDVEDGLPLVAEDVEADVPLEVDVGVVDLRGDGVCVGMGVGVVRVSDGASSAHPPLPLPLPSLTLVRQRTLGGSCGYMSGTLMENSKAAPFHRPWSGDTSRVMAVRSFGSFHVTFPTFPPSSSAMSARGAREREWEGDGREGRGQSEEDRSTPTV
jgi:hypothetical protein